MIGQKRLTRLVIDDAGMWLGHSLEQSPHAQRFDFPVQVFESVESYVIGVGQENRIEQFVIVFGDFPDAETATFFNCFM
jgi:hypothetical protein